MERFDEEGQDREALSSSGAYQWFLLPKKRGIVLS